MLINFEGRVPSRGLHFPSVYDMSLIEIESRRPVPDGKCEEPVCVNLSDTRPCNFILGYRRPYMNIILCDQHWPRHKLILMSIGLLKEEDESNLG